MKLNLKTPPPHPSLLPQASLPFLSFLPLKRCSGTGSVGYGQIITRCLCRSFLLGGGLLTLLLGSSVRSLPWAVALHKLLQRESFPPCAVLHELSQCGSLPQGAVLQEQAAPAWVATRPASKPAPAWAPLSAGPQVLAGACSSADCSWGHSLLQASTCSSAGSLPRATCGWASTSSLGNLFQRFTTITVKNF